MGPRTGWRAALNFTYVTRLAPAVVLLAVFITNLHLSPDHSAASLVIIAPLLASSLAGPRATVSYGVAALAVWALLSEIADQFVAGSARTGLLIRGLGIVVGIGIATTAAAIREKHEQQLRRLQRVATVAQRAILIPVPPRLGPLQLAARYESSARDATVGGDFFDAVMTSFGARVLLGDVRGKGLGAVRLAAATLGAFRERADEAHDLSDLLDRLSIAVTRQATPGDFVTAQIVQIDSAGCLTVVSAGHPAPILVRNQVAGELWAPATRPPLGFQARSGPPTTHQLCEADELLLYTDGVTEARRKHDREFFDEDRLLRAANLRGAPQERVDHIVDTLVTWTGRQLSDDVAVLALTYSLAGASAPSTDTVGNRASIAANALAGSTAHAVTSARATRVLADPRMPHLAPAPAPAGRELTALTSTTLGAAPESQLATASRETGSTCGTELPFDADAPGLARRFVTGQLQACSIDLQENAELLTSELVTNAVKYGRPTVHLQLTISSRAVTVRVTDHGRDMPRLPQEAPSTSASSGRGLFILDAVADDWGADTHPDHSGTTVWFSLLR